MKFDNIVNLLVDNFSGSVSHNDKTGVTRSVEAMVEFAKKHKDKYFHKDYPISKIEHDLEWWQGNKERMMKADTSYPLLVLKDEKGQLSVADGLNRLKKAKDVEEKNTIDVYIVPEEDLPDSTIVKK